jgi:O-antigen chain-terminating methyltransferase
MSKYYGFINGTVLGLQESPTLRENASPSLRDVLGGASPDYALVAQKSAPEEIIARFKAAFSLEHGLTTDTLMNRFDQHRQQEGAELSQVIAALGAQSQAIAALNAQIHAVYSSSSWRVTRPLRALGSGLRHAKEWLKLKR